MTQAQTVAHYKLGEYAHLAINKHFRKILKYEPEVLKNKDIEDLHQMRVGMRRLRSVIQGLAPAFKIPKAGRDLQIGKLGKILGRLRDLDVLQETLEIQYAPHLTKAEKKELKQVLSYLKQQRKFVFKTVKKTLKSSRYKNFKQAYSNWLENPAFYPIAQLSITSILPELLFPQLSHFFLHPGWLLGTTINNGEVTLNPDMDAAAVETFLTTEGTILHDLRKEAKRSRYNMELFTDFYGEEYQQFVNQVKSLQTILGDIQDCYVLSQFLDHLFELDLAHTMPTVLQMFKEIRFQKWQEWRKLQDYFLQPSCHHQIRSVVQSLDNEPLLVEIVAT